MTGDTTSVGGNLLHSQAFCLQHLSLLQKLSPHLQLFISQQYQLHGTESLRQPEKKKAGLS